MTTGGSHELRFVTAAVFFLRRRVSGAWIFRSASLGLILLLGVTMASAQAAVSAEGQTSSSDRFITAAALLPDEEGYGLTVLRGDSIINFPVRFIGVLHNAMASQDIVLIRLLSDPFQHTGVIAGMSGSPIYFRGRLLGALAYGWSFSKDPIAGVTPIRNMLRLIAEHDIMDTPDTLPSGWRPLSDLVWVSGLSPQRGGEAWKRIDAMGFNAAAGGREPGGPAAFIPGSAIGVRLVDGDLSMTAVGTVTYVNGRDVLAFGHPFLNRGFSRLPMTGARIETILPSTQSSFKLGSATDDVGSLLRDGQPGISGRLGASPSMIPMTVAVDALWGGRDYAFRVARDDVLSGQLFDACWAAAAEDGLFAAGPCGVEVWVTVTAAGRSVTLRDRGVVENSVLEVMPTIPVKILYDNGFGRFHPDSVAVRVRINDDRRRYEIESVKPRRAVVAPGDTIVLDVTMQIYDVGRRVESVAVRVPTSAVEGNLTVVVSGGRGLGAGVFAEPHNLNDLLDRLAGYESKDMLVTTLAMGDRGFEVDGGILPGLPPSLRRVQSGQERPSAGVVSLRRMDAPVFGIAGATVEVRNR